ncbi:MAG: hypothetical protein ABI579_09475, partial [Candidatus Sumerlaeota bacterium]
MTKLFSRIVYTAALLAIVGGVSGQNRLETPTEDIQKGLHDHESIVRVEMERLRAEREFQQQKEAEYNALDAAGKRTAADQDFAAAWEQTKDWKLESNDEFLPKALANYRLEFSSNKAVVKNEQGKTMARVEKGELLAVEHPDVSSYFLEVTDVNAATKTIKVSVGDVVYTLHDDGK